MTAFAYLRVSTDAQDVANQRHGVDAYCSARAMNPVYVEDTASGRVDWRARRLGALIDEAGRGDVVVVSEISRLARTTLQVLEIVRTCMEKGVHLHVVKAGMVMDDTMQSKITITLMGLLAELERDLISSRTREALQKRKAEGVQLGRKPGKTLDRLKLDKHRRLIQRRLNEGVPLRSIAREVVCSPHTLYAWMERRGVVRVDPRQNSLELDGGIGGVAPDGDRSA